MNSYQYFQQKVDFEYSVTDDELSVAKIISLRKRKNLCKVKIRDIERLDKGEKTIEAVRAAAKKYPDLCVVHCDAHTDLRDEYLEAKLSHATVIRRCWDVLGDGRIAQFGIRSGEGAEFRWAEKEGHTHLRRFDFAGLREAVAEFSGKPVYFTIDLDVLDPSCFPGTGTPEAGGVTFRELLDAALTVIQNANVVGCDLVELSPPLDESGASTATALKVMREMLLALEKPFIHPEQV